MSAQPESELIRVLELDYEHTTKLVEGIVNSSFTIRGWRIALISALIGLTFEAERSEIAASLPPDFRSPLRSAMNNLEKGIS